MEDIFLSPSIRSLYYLNTLGCSLSGQPIKHMTSYFCALLIAYSTGCVDLRQQSKPLCRKTCDSYVEDLSLALSNTSVCAEITTQPVASTVSDPTSGISSDLLSSSDLSTADSGVSADRLCSMKFLNGVQNSSQGCISGDNEPYCGYPTLPEACLYGCLDVNCSNVTLPISNSVGANVSTNSGSTTNLPLIVGLISTVLSIGLICGVIYLKVRRTHRLQGNKITEQVDPAITSSISSQMRSAIRPSPHLGNSFLDMQFDKGQTRPYQNIQTKRIDNPPMNNNVNTNVNLSFDDVRSHAKKKPVEIITPQTGIANSYLGDIVGEAVMVLPVVNLLSQVYSNPIQLNKRPTSFVPYVTSSVLTTDHDYQTSLAYEEHPRTSLHISPTSPSMISPHLILDPSHVQDLNYYEHDAHTCGTLISMVTTEIPQEIQLAHIRYVPALDDEIQVLVGDNIAILEAFDDEWAYGINYTQYQEGFFPVAVFGHIPGIDQVMVHDTNKNDMPTNNNITVVERRGRSLSGRTKSGVSFTSAIHTP